jgi:glycosyltransferase involved in cell wall biosynthesis
LFHPEEYRAESNDGFRLFTHGSVLKRYSIDTAIRALPLLTPRIRGLEFQILGQGEYRPELERLSLALGVENHIRFLEPVPYEAVPPYIEGADVCLLLTGVPWLSPNKVFEYAAMKKPIIAARSAFLNTVFEEGAIFIFQPGDVEEFASVVLHLYNDRAAGIESASRAHATFLAHRWELEQKSYLQVQSALIASRG